jgi:EmrB/QacA subfamily drug resistance transporter
MGSMGEREKRLVFGGMMLAGLMSSLDATILATALPAIVGELGGLDRIAWVSTAYILATSVTVPLSGRLGDLFGRRPVYLAGLLAFLAGSAACGAAPSMTWLIAFRIVQGAGAGCLMASSIALSGDLFAPRERAKYQGYTALNFAASSLAGPLIGGFLTDHASWRWAFYVNLPLGAAALAITLRYLRLPRPAGRPRIDYPGIVLLGAAVTCFTLLTSWAGTRYAFTDPMILGLGAASILLTALWIAVERRAAEPVIPPGLFRVRAYGVACVVALVGGATGFGLATYLPLYFQATGGVDATGSGLMVLPMMIGLLAASLGAGRYIAATGRYHRLPAVSMAIGAVAVALLAVTATRTTMLTAGVLMALLGFGAGLSQQVVMLIAQISAPRRDLGAAGSGVHTARMIGTAAGTAVFGGVLATRFTEELAARVRAGAVQGGAVQGGAVPADDLLRPGFLRALPEDVREGVAAAFAEAFSVVFVTALPLLLIGLAAALTLRHVPLESRAAAPRGGATSPRGEGAGSGR